MQKDGQVGSLSQNIEKVVISADELNKMYDSEIKNFANLSNNNLVSGLGLHENIINTSKNNKYLGKFFNNFEDDREIPNVNFNKYTGILHSNTTSDDVTLQSNGKININNKKYEVIPNSIFKFEDGTISQSDYNNIVYRVASDLGLTDDEKFYSYDDALGIASVYFNRLESNKFTSSNNVYGNTLTGILYEENKLVDSNSYLSKDKVDIAKCVVDDLMKGVRNIDNNVLYYVNNGTYNGFSQSIGGTTN